MASHLIWRGGQYRSEFEGQMRARVRVACSYLSSVVKADISQPGTLRYHPVGKTGKKLKQLKSVYNFTHSRPGNPPYKQSGNLRMSIAYEVVGLVGRVGSNIKKPAYPLCLELGTRRMAARPYLRSALIKNRATILNILTRPMERGELPTITSNQFRPGHFGRGARQTGWK